MTSRRRATGGKRTEPTVAERFISGALRHVKGPSAGQPFELLPWQRDQVIRPIFGPRPRKVRTAYIEVPRKNGKSTLGAALALTLLFVDDELGAEIYSAAGDRDQAAIIHDVAKQMVEANPALRKRCRIFKRTIEVPSTGSVYKVLSADAYTKHGLNASGIIFDELHVQPNRELWDVLTTSTGARAQPLTVAITTAGHDRNSICWELHEYARQVLEGSVEDDTFLPVIFAAGHDDDWTDPRVWAQANPSLGESLRSDYMEQECLRAQQIPGRQNAFKRLHLNIWTEQASVWLPMDRWDACDGSVDISELEGAGCYGGLDLATTTDMAAYALVFPGDPVRVLPRYFLPESGLRDRVLRDHVPYDVWVDQGLLTLTPGDAIDYSWIRQSLLEDGERFGLRELAFDRWNASQIITELQDDGLICVGFGQGFASMSAPSKHLEHLVTTGGIVHGGHPILRWNARNASAKLDPAGNVKPDKSTSTGRIDGLVAMIMGIGRMIVQPAESPSRWEQEGEEIFAL